MSTFSLEPKYVNNIDKIAFPKKPDIKTPILKFLFKDATIPPNIVSSAATIPIARYSEYVYDIIGAKFPIKAPIITSAIFIPFFTLLLFLYI